VADGLRAAGRGFRLGPAIVPIVPGAILFDLVNGGDKDWDENPYRALGRGALDAAAAEFAIGSHGAGSGATVAGLKGGLGSASIALDSGHVVGALVAVNAVGSPVVGDGPHFWAAPFEAGDEFGGLGPAPVAIGPALGATKLDMRAGANTTIAIVATDAVLTQAQATRMAITAHDGMAQALVPCHTPFDGDLVFAAATCEKPLVSAEYDALALGHAAAICLARAIARGVHAARTEPGDVLPTWQARFG
jgi:L-aminopeptidase/D-esterase-like protein